MAQKFFCVYHGWSEAIKSLSDSEAGRLLKCCLQYSSTGETEDLTGNERGIWLMIKSQIDKDNETSQKRKEAGSLSRSKSKQNQTKPNKAEQNQTKPTADPPSTPLNINNNNYIYPTLEEVKTYAKERNSILDPLFFYDYFSTRNWIDSKGDPVRNWKNKFVTWEKKERDRQAEQKAKEEQKPDLSWFYEDAHGIRR